MGFFDVISKAARVVSSKIDEVLTVASLNDQIKDKQNELKKIYNKVGTIITERDDYPAGTEQLVQRLYESQNTLRKIKAEIQEKECKLAELQDKLRSIKKDSSEAMHLRHSIQSLNSSISQLKIHASTLIAAIQECTQAIGEAAVEAHFQENELSSYYDKVEEVKASINKLENAILNKRREEGAKRKRLITEIVTPNKDKPTDQFYTKVVGVTFEGRQNIVKEVRPGEQLSLVRELNNRIDSNAVAVYDSKNRKLGYLSGKVAAHVGPRIDSGWYYTAEVTAVTGGDNLNYGVNIIVYGHPPSTNTSTQKTARHTNYGRTESSHQWSYYPRITRSDEYYLDESELDESDFHCYDPEADPDVCCGYDH